MNNRWKRRRREYLWNSLNYILSQRSILSIVISLILINHLINILICSWTYIFTDALIKTSPFNILFQPTTIVPIIELCPIVSKNYNRRSIYLFGYIYVWITIIIACLLPDRWELIFANTVRFLKIRFLRMRRNFWINILGRQDNFLS